MRPSGPSVIRIIWDDAKVEKILHLLEKTIMPTIQEIQDKVDSIQKDVTEEGTVIESVVALLEGLNTLVADLRQQLADAIAANDPAKLQATLDSLTALQTTIDDQKAKLAAAVPASTTV